MVTALVLYPQTLARMTNSTDIPSRVVGDDADTLLWTPVECCVGVICACLPCMTPLQRLFGGDSTRTGYHATEKARAIGTPLTLPNAWPGEHCCSIANVARIIKRAVSLMKMPWHRGWTLLQAESFQDSIFSVHFQLSLFLFCNIVRLFNSQFVQSSV